MCDWDVSMSHSSALLFINSSPCHIFSSLRSSSFAMITQSLILPIMASTFLDNYFDHSANLSQSSASFRFTGRHHRHLRPQECLRLCFHIFVESQMVSGDSNCELKTMFGPSLPLGPNMNKHRCMCKVYCTKKKKKMRPVKLDASASIPHW